MGDTRTVHGKTPEGDEIVRYDRAGKWYRESETGRQSLNIAAAVYHVCRAGGEAFIGRPGGRRFDAMVRDRRV